MRKARPAPAAAGTPPDEAGFLAAGGGMGAAMRSFDFSRTALGPVADWPASLRAATSICLNSRYPMFIAWGAHRSMLYNDAYTAVLAGKHPRALGRPAQEVWAEIWDILGPHWSRVFEKGEPTWAEDLLLVMNRSGYPEETYFTFSYSPIRDEGGRVGGMFCACQETTEKVVGQRRLGTLRALASQGTSARTPGEACSAAMRTLAANPSDLPFALLYLVEDAGTAAVLAGTAGLEPGMPASPPRIGPDAVGHGGWPLGPLLRDGAIRLLDDLPARFAPLPSGPWEEPTTTAILLPIRLSANEPPSGALVAGVSPVRPLDDGYRTFFEVAAGQIASAISNARAFEGQRRRAEALAELDRAKTSFFTNISHEFRTPLTLMLGPLEDLLRELPPEPTRRPLETAHRNALRLLKLVNTLLDFTRIEAARVQVVYEPTDLAAATADLAGAFRSAVEKAGLRLVVDCPPLPGPVYVDREMWEKIVLNLLSNAFKFTFEGGITVSLGWSSPHVELTVRDTGTGIPAEELPHVFDRFHRVPNARARTHEGTGIGLALVSELVRLHGGSIAVDSVVGQGTAFTVRLPTGEAHLPREQVRAARSQASTAIGAAPFVEEALRWLPDAPPRGEATVEPMEVPGRLPALTPERGREAGRVLLADDNADMRQYLGRLLSRYWEVEAVADGAAALEAALRRPPDLVLTDIMMPGLDGFELLRRLRAHPATREIPVILLSARAGEEARVEGIGAGADDYLIKPFSARELAARVRTHLELARVRREARRALQESEERFRLAAQAAKIGAYSRNMQTGEDYWSPEFLAIFGVGPAGPLPLKDGIPEAVHPEDRPGVLAEARAHFERPDAPEFSNEHRIVLPDGRTRWVLVRGRTEFDARGRPQRTHGFAMDITGRKESELRLQELNRTLEQRVAERTELAEARARQLQGLAVQLIEAEEQERRRVANLLHDDLQQVLASARLQLQAACLSLPPVPALANVERLLEETIGKSRRLSHELSPAVLHHSGLATALEWLARQLDERYGLEVRLELEAVPAAERGPMKLFLFRAVQELLFNAARHSGVQSARVALSAVEDRLVVTVSDEGRGFDPAVLESYPVRSGFGLLSLRERVRSMGGSLAIESGPGRGSRFTLAVPLTLFPDEEPPGLEPQPGRLRRSPARRPASETAGAIRVLFADDHQVMRQGLLSLIAGQPGIQVVGEADDGQEAVELARQLHPDVVVMDVSMPRMNGVEATRRIKSERPGVRIIGLSMYEDAQIAGSMRQAGAEAFVSKTASSGELLKAIYGLAAPGRGKKPG